LATISFQPLAKPARIGLLVSASLFHILMTFCDRRRFLGPQIVSSMVFAISLSFNRDRWKPPSSSLALIAAI
jgi:hypothetical protein